MTKRNFDPDKDLRNASAKTKEIEKNFGTIVLRTNILDKPSSH